MYFSLDKTVFKYGLYFYEICINYVKFRDLMYTISYKKGGDNMIQRILRYVIAILFGIMGFMAVDALMPYISPFLDQQFWQTGFFGISVMVIACIVLGGLIGAIFGYVISDFLLFQGLRFAKSIERLLNRVPVQNLVSGTLGLLFGLIIANLIGMAFERVPLIGSYLPIILSAILGYIGISLGSRKGPTLYKTILNYKNSLPKEVRDVEQEGKLGNEYNKVSSAKLLDTSVIIDGRIADIVSTGFLEGPFVVPLFVLEELQRISDSSDGLKRNRGRRGLDILQAMQQNESFPLIVVNDDYEDIPEVDSKLMKLAIEKEWKLVTNDFNLNKVATLQGISVLNLNELANAIKPVMISGEWIRVQVVKEGKENNQGVAYLDDGTMIVIENGAPFVDQMIDVMVTSVLQTSAGRMIFAKVEGKKE